VIGEHGRDQPGGELDAGRRDGAGYGWFTGKNGQIAGAGLDVFVEEPPKPNNPLFTLPNVTLSPHSAGPTWENWTARFRNGFDNIQRVAAGDKPRWVIPELA
jgi:phosphoglycerate dehydrogenase-like enzyme